MKPLRVVICDDEELANDRLASLLGRIGEVEIVGTASNGGEALALVEETRPDLVLLDIEMPDMDGFDVVEQLGRLLTPGWDAPLVAFVTAFRRFAPEAFDSGAIDFLSKPVRLARLEKTIDRARRAQAGREAGRRLIDLQGMLDALRDNRDPYREAHVWVPRRGEVVRVDLDQIDRIAAEGAYVRLHVESNSFLHREAIGTIEAKLDPVRFVRVHRSHLVRIDHVASIKRTIHGGGELLLRSGERIPLGRKYARTARQRLTDTGHRG